MSYFLSVLSGIASYYYMSLGINTYKANKKSKECLVFLILNICLSIWSFFYAFAYVTTDNYYLFSLWNKLSAIGWCNFTALILYLSLTITKNKIVDRLYIKVLIFTPGILLLFTTAFFIGPGIETPPYIITFFYVGDFLYNNIYFIISMCLIYFWGRKSKKVINKKQSRIILITSVLSFSLNLLTQSILPLFGIKTITTLGQIYSLIMMIGVKYSITHYHFLRIPISLITKELFHEIMDLTFLVDIDGNIIRINKQAKTLLQYEENEIVHKSVTNIIQNIEFTDIINNNKHISGTLRLNNIMIRMKTGEEIPTNITISPLKDPQEQKLLGFLIVGQDIRIIRNLMEEMSNHKITAEKLRLNEELFRTMIEAMPFSIVLTKIKDNTILYINNKTEELYRVKQKDILGKEVIIFYENPEDRINIVEEIKQQKFIKEKEVVFKRWDDTTFTGAINVIPTVYNDEEVLLGCVVDTTESRMLQQNVAKSEEMFRKLMNSIPDLVTVCDNDGNITFMNNSIKTLLGYDPIINSPKTIFDILLKEDIERAKSDIETMIQKGIAPVEYIHRKKDGSTIIAEVNGTVLRDNNNELFGMLFISRDITERKKIQERLQKSKEDIEKINNELVRTNSLLQEKSTRDSLTGFFNHQYINELLEEEIKDAIKCNSKFCLMMLDIDYFKRVNDSYGHQVGDKVLVIITNLIKLNVRQIDLIGRYGGEEFMIILPNTNIEDVLEIAENIRRSIVDFKYEIPELKTTISVGIAEYKGEDAKGLINRADTLLYQAKDKGRNRVEYRLIE